MKTVIPDYYRDFKCIADRCRHTCCAGWEIDVDARALERYRQVKGALGQKLRDSIIEDDCPHFRLTAGERCPFLNERNLCQLYLELGESSLCQICSDHPRFRNDLSDRTEIGLGLCCEAAAELILGRTEKTVLLESTEAAEDEPEPLDQLIEAVRDRAFGIIQDRSASLQCRIDRLLREFQIRLPEKTAAGWADCFLALERMEEGWGELLLRLKQEALPERALPELEIPLEQLTVYFLYRHLPAAQDENDIRSCLAFAVLGCRMIRWLCLLTDSHTLPQLAELARLYSSEIEYCEENTQALLELLWEANNK